MIRKMQNGEMTLQQVIAQCQKTGQLSKMQIKILEDAAPVDIDENQEV
jgi:exonuclease VII small subunit